MAKAFKLFNPNDGTVVMRDCDTGAILTAAQMAAATPCPQRSVVSSAVCLQPIGNLDPALVESGGKEVSTYEQKVDADDVFVSNELIDTILLDASGADVTATHEVTACLTGLLPVGEICYTA
jgi:hypothetical protein